MREKELEKIKEYKYGFSTDIENIRAPKGLNKEVIKFISNIKKEPQWMLDWRLKAYERFQQLKEPDWQKPKFPKIDYQGLYYYSAPKSVTDKPKNLEDLDPKLLETYSKLGIPLVEQKRLNNIAVDAVFDSVSVATTFKDKLTEQGIIFCSMSEAIQKHPELVKKYLGSVIPLTDHYFATLNSAVFTDGSFVYIPEGIRCPMELSTYFRINASETGQFERTLIFDLPLAPALLEISNHNIGIDFHLTRLTVADTPLQSPCSSRQLHQRQLVLQLQTLPNDRGQFLPYRRHLVDLAGDLATGILRT
jgi:Fe-S cluster assembly protein SufB